MKEVPEGYKAILIKVRDRVEVIAIKKDAPPPLILKDDEWLELSV